MLNQKTKQYEIIIGNKLKVETDKKTDARFIHLPFEFPDEERGALVLIKTNDPTWMPYKEIGSLIINFT